MKRLAQRPGEWIDRAKPIAFSFEGRQHSGFAGDTLTSALMANGVRTLGRSFKYHRRRGTLSAANHDANAIVQIESGGRSIPNARADVLPIAEGLAARAVNTQGGLEHDMLAAQGRFCDSIEQQPGGLLAHVAPCDTHRGQRW